MANKTELKNNTEPAIAVDTVLGCVDGLSHVERTILSMSDKDIEASRKDIMRNGETIKTVFGDIVLIKHPIFNAP